MDFTQKKMTKTEKFELITATMAKTYKAKNHDYGNSFDNTCDLFGITAAIVRMYDKMQRIITLSKTESYVKDERIEDTLLDLANYCIMTLMYLQNGKDK